VHIRVVATSECDLSALAAEGAFSSALCYHLAALTLRALPLREIREDIPLLARRYLFSAALRQERRIRKIKPEVFSFSAQMDWPGNAVQLKGEMERLVSLMGRDGEIRAAMFPAGTEPRADAAPALWTLDEKEREAIALALLRCGRDSAGKRAAAAELGISLATLYRKMKHYDL
jgi:DNA-binding NtrC family response regulator